VRPPRRAARDSAALLVLDLLGRPARAGRLPARPGAPVRIAADPGTVPKAVDVITPGGVDQTIELDPTQQPVLIQGVPVP
jgi:glucoamylase